MKIKKQNNPKRVSHEERQRCERLLYSTPCAIRRKLMMESAPGQLLLDFEPGTDDIDDDQSQSTNDY